MKKIIKISLFFFAFVFSFLIFFFIFKGSVGPKDAFVSLGGTTINVQVVRSPAELTLGLSGRESLEGGMWFVFPKADYYAFWMKDMKFPIDIIWIAEDFTIVDIKENAQPDSFPEAFRPKAEALYVLEVPAGFSKENQLRIGYKVTFSDK